MDKRQTYRFRAFLSLAIFILIWFSTVVWASEISNAGGGTFGEVLTIGGLLGLVQVLIGYIYVSGIRSIKESIRTLFQHLDEIEKTKLSKEDHDRLCRLVSKKEE